MTASPSFLLDQYRKLLRETEEWFGLLKNKYAERVQCGCGCSQCCYGLFDVSLADASIITAALEALSEESRSAVLHSALQIQQRIGKQLVEIAPPYLLHTVGPDRIDEIASSMPDVPCPFLGRSDECLIYGERPLACRLEGFPMVDAQDGLFGDWCELNFTEGLPRESVQDFSLDYYAIQAVEFEANRSLSERWFGRIIEEATVFIPSMICYPSPFRP